MIVKIHYIFSYAIGQYRLSLWGFPQAFAASIKVN